MGRGDLKDRARVSACLEKERENEVEQVIGASLRGSRRALARCIVWCSPPLPHIRVPFLNLHSGFLKVSLVVGFLFIYFFGERGVCLEAQQQCAAHRWAEPHGPRHTGEVPQRRQEAAVWAKIRASRTSWGAERDVMTYLVTHYRWLLLPPRFCLEWFEFSEGGKRKKKKEEEKKKKRKKTALCARNEGCQ